MQGSTLASSFTWGSAQARKTGFQGSLLQALLWKLRTSHGNYFQGKSPKSLSVGSAQTPGQAEPIFTRPLVLRTEYSQCVRVEEGRLFPGDYIERHVLLLTSKKKFIRCREYEKASGQSGRSFLDAFEFFCCKLLRGKVPC